MRLLYTLLFVGLVQIGLAQDCNAPISNQQFHSHYNIVAGMPSDQQKLNVAAAFAKNRCLSSNQITLVSSLFVSDYYRLEYGKSAYKSCFDKTNFYDVYDAFATFSSALRLHDYVRDIEAANDVIVVEDPTPKPLPVEEPHQFPSYNYPVASNYSGHTGCGAPVSDADFLILVQNVIKQPTEESKVLAANNLIGTTCLSMAQAMKVVSLFQVENNRLQFLKNNFWAIYDLDNYPYASITMTQANYANDWIAFCEASLTPAVVEDPDPVVETPVCESTDAQVKDMAKRLDDAAFASDQMKLMQAFNNSHCLNVNQVGMLMDEFSFPDDKKAVAKMCYAKCTNQNQYYKLTDHLTFSRDKDELLEFIRNQN